MVGDLRIDGVTCLFGRVKALDDVRLSLPAKTLSGMIGPNGAGKSTLLDVLSGFLQPADGGVARKSTGARLARTELVSSTVRLHQRDVLPGELAVRDFFAVSAYPSASGRMWGAASPPWAQLAELIEDQPERARLLEFAGIETLSERRLAELSWGERRIVGLVALTLVDKPVFLLDEPFAGLAPEARSAASELLLWLARDHTVLVAEHDLETLFGIAERVIVLVEGRVEATGSPHSLSSERVLGFFRRGSR